LLNGELEAAAGIAWPMALEECDTAVDRYRRGSAGGVRKLTAANLARDTGVEIYRPLVPALMGCVLALTVRISVWQSHLGPAPSWHRHHVPTSWTARPLADLFHFCVHVLVIHIMPAPVQ